MVLSTTLVTIPVSVFFWSSCRSKPVGVDIVASTTTTPSLFVIQPGTSGSEIRKSPGCEYTNIGRPKASFVCRSCEVSDLDCVHFRSEQTLVYVTVGAHVTASLDGSPT